MRASAVALLATLIASAASAQTPPMAPDIPPKFEPQIPNADYITDNALMIGNSHERIEW